MLATNTLKIALLFLIILFGCNPSDKNEDKEESFIAYSENESFTAIQFNKFTLFVENERFYDEEGFLKQVNRDTVRLFLELGEVLENKKMYIISEVLKDITIEQRYQTTAVISLDGEQCELHDWKHYESAWTRLTEYSNGIFRVLSYTEEDGRHFPATSLEEYTNAVNEYCGVNFTQQAQKVKSIIEFPGFVGISKYHFRITGKHSVSGEKSEYILTVNLPLSC